MTRERVLEIFRNSGALLEGHFILRSGLRSRQFFQCALALQKMPEVEELGAGLVDRVKDLEVETVIAPAMGGLVIGQEVARQLRCRYIFVEKEEGRLVLRRGFRLRQGERVLIVEDVVTRGGRVDEAIAIAREHGAEVQGVAVLVDRSNGRYDPGVPFRSLLSVEVQTFEPDNLPEDLKAIDPVKPGSR